MREKILYVKLFLLNFLASFIPYFKRMQEKATVLELINQYMLGFINRPASKLKPASRIISNENHHEIHYEIALRSGEIIIAKLIYEKGKFEVLFNLTRNDNFNSFVLSEFYAISWYIEANMDTARMAELFSKLT